MAIPNLRRRRSLAGDSIADYAERSGLSTAYVSKLETGRQFLPSGDHGRQQGIMAKLAKLAECYGVKLPSLLRCMRKG